tara:strand:+ start:615 stop:863 length:249 start_codon:yes stop_codon:yes gene_type:complete
MVHNEKEYDIVKERQSEDVITITYTKKERLCDTCLKIKKAKNIRIVKYPILHRDMGRLIMDKQICDDCYDDVKEVLDNLKYN